MPIVEALKTLEEIAAEDAFVYRVDLPDRRAIETHAHAQGQLFSVQSGLCIIETSTGSWLFPPRRCGWIPAGHLHSMRSRGQTRGWSLYLAAPLCESLPKQPMVLSLSPLLEHLVMRLATWRQSPPSERSRKSFVEVLVDEIAMAQEQPLHLPMPQDARLTRLVEEITQHPDLDRPLNMWARQLGMSERSLQREFHRETHITIGQWRQQFRILISLERLSEGMSVTETCFAVGYKSVSAFIKTFKRIVGVTPLEYSKSL
jgi:AraC-like DNA-binding protein